MGIRKLGRISNMMTRRKAKRIRKGLSASRHGLDDDIRVLHEHGNGGVLDGRRLDEAHGVDSLEDPFGQGRGEGAKGAICF
jgi:hypothetical protein